MRPFLILLTLATIAGCSQAEKTYSVEDFLADESLLAEHVQKCRNNPGELGQTPNCVNAAAADGKARLERMNKALGG
ncbi:EexN family lipoprotein [Agrobacterium tumefaciens]|uniref:EexN family lipoprotein n=1 Tax=Agrobacterium tumefaciens TaxID=358 RepID=UPI0022447D50|nr:EexN family lipoprotein [Agrobacterium tumefaciens]MCW8060578.1 EexN family lipoprotein [Agrobacterium tumefaciens]MCW8146021.1 EexN family lipoprotein [Agrobacterium tumefaciens]